MSKVKLIAFVLVAVLVVQAQLRFTVQNPSSDRLQEIVSYRLTARQSSSLPKDAGIFEITDGVKVPVPSAFEREPDGTRVFWMLPGLSRADTTRSFVVSEASERANDDTTTYAGLLSAVSDEHFITISNQFFTLRHPRRGSGGQPQDITFNLSGHKYPGLYLHDRIFDKKYGQFMIANDQEATAVLVSASQLHAVVQTQSRYILNGKTAPGNPVAIYRYEYTAFSPVVHVSISVTQTDPTDWNELHFLHVSHQDRVFTSFSSGEPFKNIPILRKGEKSRGYNATQWAVMQNDSDAAGIGFSPSICWDAANIFIYYVRSRSVTSLPAKGVTASSCLYLGPASGNPEWYRRWLSPKGQPIVTATSSEPTAAQSTTPTPLPKGAYTLKNQDITVTFAGVDRGCGVLAVSDTAAPAVRFVTPVPAEAPPLWRLTLNKGVGKEDRIAIDAAAKPPQVSLTEDVITFVWRDIPLPADKGTISVNVRVAAKGPSTEWHLSIQNNSHEVGLLESEFPVLGHVFNPGTAQVLLPTGNWGGTLISGNKPAILNNNYPSAACPLQCLAFMKEGRGLYFAAHDGAARTKRFILTPSQELTINVPAENMGVPGSGRNDDFPVVISLFNGSWWNAAKIYRQWAIQQPWTAYGPLASNDRLPDILRNLGFWMLLSGEPKQITHCMRETAERSPVPVGVHWYSWHKIPFDNSYPEYFPTEDGMPEATHAMVAAGQVVMPYINGRLWDHDIDSFKHAKPFACLNEKSQPYIEQYGSGRLLVPMCPATPFWQHKIQEVCTRLFDECGVNAIYLDQIGAARPKLCLNPEHGHPLGGGKHWVDGYRKMLTPIKNMAMKRGAFLTTENTAEPYMDNIDAYLAWNERVQNDVPLLPAVYSGYTVYFTSPQDDRDDLTAFRAAQGRDFLWGCQLGWNNQWILDAKHTKHFDFQMQLAQLRLATLDFQLYGQLIGDITPLNDIPQITVTWNRRKPHQATLPAVIATRWQDQTGTFCDFFVNCTDDVIPFTRRVNLPQIPIALLSRVTPDGTAPMAKVTANDIHTVILKPGEAIAIKATPLPANDILTAHILHNTTKDPILKETADNFLFTESLRTPKNGLTVTPEKYRLKCVRGENTPFSCRIDNPSPDKTADISLLWPDGTAENVTIPPNSSHTCRRKLNSEALTAPISTLKASIDPHTNFVRTLTIPIQVLPVLPVSVTLSLPQIARSGDSFIANAIVTNNSSVPQNANLLVKAPADWNIMPSRMVMLGNIMPAQHKIVLLSCTPAPTGNSSTADISAILFQKAEHYTVKLLKARPILHAKQLHKPPKIDANLEEWKDADFATVGLDTDSATNFKKYGGISDCSATLKCAWDKNFLYLAAIVTDENHTQIFKSADIWRGDSIQFDLRHGGPGTTPGTMDGTESESAIALHTDGPVWFHWQMKASVNNPPNPANHANPAKLAITRDENCKLTTYEAAIPWNSIELPTPHTNARLGFSFTVLDNDNGIFNGWLEWTPGVCGPKDSSQFGLLILE